jgi:hypothetical protein
MKYREVPLPHNQTVPVPQGIQRIDSPSTHGWQVRYQGSKLFSDGSDADPKRSLADAVNELIVRIETMSAPVPLNRRPSANKSSSLPSGISGPIVRGRAGRALTAELSILLPRFGQPPEHKKIHIGSQNTYTVEKYYEALAKGLEMREQAVASYERDATESRRAQSAELRALLSKLRRTK